MLLTTKIFSMEEKETNIKILTLTSVGQASSHKAKGHSFDYRSGHMPELRIQSLLRVRARSNQWRFSLTLMFLFLSHSLPPPL